MLVILEGPDGSGKSSLATQLKEAGLTLVRQPRGIAFTYRWMRLLAKSKRATVFDRWGVTSWVYRLLDNEPLDEVDFTFSEMCTILKNSVIVYCTNKNAFENSIKRGETNIRTKQKAKELKRLYDFAINTIKLYKLSTVIEFDFSKDSVDELLQKLNKR